MAARVVAVVASAAHRPIAGLVVHLIVRRDIAGDSARDSVVATTRTAADGAFLLDASSPGTYRVQLGEAHVGPPLVLATVDAEDQHQYVLAPVPPADGPPGPASMYHMLHGAELDSVLAAHTPLLAFQVDAKAAPVVGTVRPTFPPALSGRQAVGSLLAEFVVDTLGHLDRSTLRISRSPGTDQAFVEAVAHAVADARFTAALADQRRVRQRVYLPVIFRSGGTAVPSVAQGSPCGPLIAYDAAVVTTVSGLVRRVRMR